MTLSLEGNKGNEGAERTQGKTMTYVTQVGLRPHDFITRWEQRRSGCCEDTWEKMIFFQYSQDQDQMTLSPDWTKGEQGAARTEGQKMTFVTQVGLGQHNYITQWEQRQSGCCEDTWEDNDFYNIARIRTK